MRGTPSPIDGRPTLQHCSQKPSTIGHKRPWHRICSARSRSDWNNPVPPSPPTFVGVVRSLTTLSR
jgi:hypothetical protein